MVYKCTFPSQANRFLGLQVFAPSPSLCFSVHLSFLFISCFYTCVFKCSKQLYKGKELPKSVQSNLLLTPLRSKLRKIQGLLKDLNKYSRTSQGCASPELFSNIANRIQNYKKNMHVNLLILSSIPSSRKSLLTVSI